MAAFVEEATNAGRYVTGHAYTAARSVAAKAGFRCVEHANLIDGATARLMADKGMFLVGRWPRTRRWQTSAPTRGCRPTSWPSASGPRRRPASIELARTAGVRLVYGTDLLGAMHDAQLTEFALRAQVQPAAEVLRAATVDAAALLDQPDLGRIGGEPTRTCSSSTPTRWATSRC